MTGGRRPRRSCAHVPRRSLSLSAVATFSSLSMISFFRQENLSSISFVFDKKKSFPVQPHRQTALVQHGVVQLGDRVLGLGGTGVLHKPANTQKKSEPGGDERKREGGRALRQNSERRSVVVAATTTSKAGSSSNYPQRQHSFVVS